MTQDAAVLIRVNVREEPDYFYAASPDLPGLHVCGGTREQLCDSLIRALKALFKHNRNLDVQVLPVVPPESDDFPLMPAACFGDQFVVHRLAQ